MKSANLLYRRLGIFLISGLWFAAASCNMLEQQIDRTAGGPSVPADTTVSMRLESMEPSDQKAPQMVSPGPLKITISEAILLTLENNRALVVERLNPSIQKTFEDQERAVFDPETNAEISGGRTDTQRLSRIGVDTEDETIDTVEGVISLEQFFPTGTTVAIEGSSLMTDSSLNQDSFCLLYTSPSPRD